MIFSRPQVETTLDLSGYETALSKAQKLTSKDQEEVASVVASMKYAMDNHLLTERMVACTRISQPTTRSDCETRCSLQVVKVKRPPILEVPEYKSPLGTAGEESAPILDVPEYKGPLGTAGEEQLLMKFRIQRWSQYGRA